MAITKEDLYKLQDSQILPPGDDETSPKIHLYPPFFYFGSTFSNLYVSRLKYHDEVLVYE